MSLFKLFGRDCFVAAFLAMTLFLQFFVLPSFAADDEMTVSVPEYVTITKSYNNYSATITNITDDYVRLSSVVESFYVVYTNGSPYIYCYFTAPVQNGEEVLAWNGKSGWNGSGKIVLTRNDNSATAAAVENALSDSPEPSQNANAIAFLGHAYHYISDSNKPVFINDTGIGVYQITDNASRIHLFAGSVKNNCSSISGTFSPHDSSGVYTVTAHITTISP